jgi:hypothetical protein
MSAAHASGAAGHPGIRVVRGLRGGEDLGEGIRIEGGPVGPGAEDLLG